MGASVAVCVRGQYFQSALTPTVQRAVLHLADFTLASVAAEYIAYANETRTYAQKTV